MRGRLCHRFLANSGLLAAVQHRNALGADLPRGGVGQPQVLVAKEKLESNQQKLGLNGSKPSKLGV